MSLEDWQEYKTRRVRLPNYSARNLKKWRVYPLGQPSSNAVLLKNKQTKRWNITPFIGARKARARVAGPGMLQRYKNIKRKALSQNKGQLKTRKKRTLFTDRTKSFIPRQEKIRKTWKFRLF